MRDPHDPQDPSRPTYRPGTNIATGSVQGSLIQAGSIRELHLHLGNFTRPVPRQLPPAPRQFVNRLEEVTSLETLLFGNDQPGTVPVVLVAGGHGYGKSALTAFWANQVKGRFTDGQLYDDCERDAVTGTTAVSEILGSFLRSLGVTDEAIPSNLGEKVALYRSRTAGMQLLVVLENVDFPAVISQLTPTGPGSAILATTSEPLEDFIRLHRPGVVRVETLDEESSKELLVSMVGRPRCDAEPHALSRLLQICDGLPIALCICGALLASSQQRRIFTLVEQIDQGVSRLDAISTAQVSLSAIFDEAYRQLPDDQARLFRSLGLHPGPTFTSGAVAAISGDSPSQVTGTLDQLEGAYLVERIHGRNSTQERYRLHRLLREFVRDKVRDSDEDGHPEVSLRRCVTYYRDLAQRLDRALIPDRLRLAHSSPSVVFPDNPIGIHDSAMDVFEDERPNFLAAMHEAFDRGWNEEVWVMGEALWPAYHNHKHFDEAPEVYRMAADAAENCANRDAQARMLAQLARARLDCGDADQACVLLDEARQIATGTTHPYLQGSLMEWAGIAETERLNYDIAIGHFEDARRIHDAAARTRGVALAEYHLGRTLTLAGRSGEAIAHLERAKTMIDSDGDPLTWGRVLLRLGEALVTLGRSDEAQMCLVESIETMSKLDADIYIAMGFQALGDADVNEGQLESARANFDHAIEYFERVGSDQASRVRERLELLSRQ